MTPQLVGVSTTELPLGKLSGKHAFAEKLKVLGYDISPEDQIALFKQFKEVLIRRKQYQIVTSTQLFKVLNMNKMQSINLRIYNFNMYPKDYKVLL